MKYIVINDFKDLKDKGYVYREGDEYPREGLKLNEKRAAELAGENNKAGKVLIEKVEEPKQEQPAETTK